MPPVVTAVRVTLLPETTAVTDAPVSLLMAAARPTAMDPDVSVWLKVYESPWLFTVTVIVPASKIVFFPPVRAEPELPVVNDALLKCLLSFAHEDENA